jgi:hypothetical protein
MSTNFSAHKQTTALIPEPYDAHNTNQEQMLHCIKFCVCSFCPWAASAATAAPNPPGAVAAAEQLECVMPCVRVHHVCCRAHDDDICCLALAPDKRIAATGQLGKDPTILVS